MKVIWRTLLELKHTPRLTIQNHWSLKLRLFLTPVVLHMILSTINSKMSNKSIVTIKRKEWTLSYFNSDI